MNKKLPVQQKSDDGRVSRSPCCVFRARHCEKHTLVLFSSLVIFLLFSSSTNIFFCHYLLHVVSRPFCNVSVRPSEKHVAGNSTGATKTHCLHMHSKWTRVNDLTHVVTMIDKPEGQRKTVVYGQWLVDVFWSHRVQSLWMLLFFSVHLFNSWSCVC